MRQCVSIYSRCKKVHNCSCCSEACLCECSTRLLCAWDKCDHWLGSYQCAVQHRPQQHYLIANQSASSRRMPMSSCGHLRPTWVAALADASSSCQDAICLGPLAVIFDSRICGCRTRCMLSPWAVFLSWVFGCTIRQRVLLCHWLCGLIINVKMQNLSYTPPSGVHGISPDWCLLKLCIDIMFIYCLLNYHNTRIPFVSTSGSALLSTLTLVDLSSTHHVYKLYY